LEEAIQKVPLNEEVMFRLQMPKNNKKLNMTSTKLKNKAQAKDKIIKIRKHEMIIEVNKKTLLMVRDLSDQVQVE
jgi:hypothetical protein